MPYAFNPLTGQLDYYQIDTVGLTQATADGRYLKLDASNGPVTGGFTVTGTVAATAFSGDGSALTNLPASGLTTGQVQALAAGYANLFNY
jgi:hypothetical protein